MKKAFVFAALLLVGSSFAQTPQSVNCPTGATSCATSIAVTESQANNEITVVLPGTSAPAKQEIVQSGTTTLKNVPSVSGPPLASSNDTCMGSMSGSVNIAGLGLGGGGTFVDDNCKMLKNSRELWNMGMRAAALALMCTDPANRAALETTGYECPRAKQAVVEERRPITRR